MTNCECVIVVHKDPPRCAKTAKYLCGKCQAKLCERCSNEHHAHGKEHRTKLQERADV